MNKQTRDRLYPIISKRDGNYCKCCGKFPHESNLVLDHKDNDNTNNTHTNLQILCRACNYMKNPRKEPLDLCVNNKVESDNNSCMVINKIKEPEFLEYVKDRITNEDAVKLKDLINSGARKVDISPVTAKRYIEKHSSEGGELMLIDDLVIFSQYHDFSNDPRIIWRNSLNEL